MITADMQDLVGRPHRRVVSYPIARLDIRRWAMATYYPAEPPPRYADAEPLLAPREFNPFAWAVADEQKFGPAASATPEQLAAGAIEHLLGVEPPQLYRALNGGVSCQYGAARMRVGDVITATATIAEYGTKESRLGSMLLTTIDTVLTNHDRQHIRTDRLVLIRY